MPRYAYGPSQLHVIGGDVEISLDTIHVDKGEGTVNVTVPPYGEDSARLDEVSAVFSGSPPAIGETPEDFLARPENKLATVACAEHGADAQPLAITVPGLTAGSWFVQTVLKFAS